MRVCELLLPVEVLWNVEPLLKEADYLVASGAEAVEVQGIYQQALRRLTPFAVSEKDRTWLRELAHGRK